MSTTLARRPPPLTVLTAARLGLGLTALFMPRTGARLFRMDAEGTPAVAMGRMFGIRNVALAAGLLRLDTITVPRRFVRINIVIDFVDALALLAARHRREIGTAATVLGTGIALSAVGVGAAGLTALPEATGEPTHRPPQPDDHRAPVPSYPRWAATHPASGAHQGRRQR